MSNRICGCSSNQECKLLPFIAAVIVVAMIFGLVLLLGNNHRCNGRGDHIRRIQPIGEVKPIDGSNYTSPILDPSSPLFFGNPTSPASPMFNN